MRKRNRRRLVVEPLETRTVLSSYHVAPTGNDAADGSAQAPWRTLQHAADSARPGDEIDVRAGHYAGFILYTSGTQTSPITFRAEPGTVIDTRNPTTPDGINLEGASYVTIQGFQVVGMPRAGIRSVINEHVTIRDNVADNNAVWGIFSGFSDDLVIEGNVASRSREQHGIYVSNSGDRPIIRRNVVWGNNDSGIHMNGDASAGGDGIISGAVVEANTIYDNGLGGGSGINADGVQSSRFVNNLLRDNHASGISLFRDGGGGGSSGNVVVNNTVVMAPDGRWALNIQDGSTGNVAYNNILFNENSFRGSIDISPDSLPGFVSNNNVMKDRLTTDGGGTILTLAQWRQATGQDANSTASTPNSVFVAAAEDDYRLRADSPAIDAGTPNQAPASDLVGSPRPSGLGWDIGAYEAATPLQVNRAPVAVDDSARTLVGRPVVIPALANDSDPDGDRPALVGVTQGAGGTPKINADGTITYTPRAGFAGTDRFTYTISDGNGNTASAVVTVTVDAMPNRMPRANADSFVARRGQQATFNPLGNDLDPDGDALQIVGITQPSHGEVVVNPDGTLTYRPSTTFVGTVRFAYLVSDGRGGISMAMVTVKISK